jgi:transcriptional regulator CtsR
MSCGYFNGMVGIMSNIADLIEAYILRQLAKQQDGTVELRRTDIADKISCAPSQISYVLSTRFTHDKGFVVESRRGLGGYIRIVHVPIKNLVYKEMLEKIDGDTTYGEAQDMVKYLLQHEMITNREAALCMQVVTSLFESQTMDLQEKVQLLKSMLMTLANFS